MGRSKVEYTLEAVQARLKADKVGVTVRQRGQRLELRATLPPKEGSGKYKPYDQVIALGYYANPASVARAIQEAKAMGHSLQIHLQTYKIRDKLGQGQSGRQWRATQRCSKQINRNRNGNRIRRKTHLLSDSLLWSHVTRTDHCSYK
ncbi:hypothetical protein [Gloeobacter kilaueensis]|uniref:Phage integrase n=1 Tax=Gloeobacter kilaueensis (strain ATCC BAA-2537 / CCAP 1431/1 / ULC 316 / JS1) TaxID=1183438 RepID=U5QPW5_GLOK1|nr:hypothetical protein [Gloeobacter kilaueensis]AGY59735.1 phage integrase [Gloeobacter kilaueensis JS1]